MARDVSIGIRIGEPSDLSALVASLSDSLILAGGRLVGERTEEMERTRLFRPKRG